MTLTRKDSGPQWMFWLAVTGVVSSFFIGPIGLLLCVPMLAFVFTPPKGETQ